MGNVSSIIDFYNSYDEENRLKSTYGKLEFTHMTELLMRYLPKAPAKICDIGGATGDYAFYFAKLGYDVYLIDIVPRHIEIAKKRAHENGYINSANFIVGDAMKLPYTTNTFDAVFLSGPLYHLPNRNDRIRVLSEAKRVLKPSGTMAAYTIGRFATLFYGVNTGKIYEKLFMDKLKKEVETGYRFRYENEDNILDNAYFHTSNELKEEVTDAGLYFKAMHGVIGSGWMAPNFDEAWLIEERRDFIMDIARMSEAIPDACSKIFIVAKK